MTQMKHPLCMTQQKECNIPMGYLSAVNMAHWDHCWQQLCKNCTKITSFARFRLMPLLRLLWKVKFGLKIQRMRREIIGLFIIKQIKDIRNYLSTLHLLTGQLNCKGACFLSARNFNKLDLMVNGLHGCRLQRHDKSCFVNLLIFYASVETRKACEARNKMNCFPRKS